MSEYILPVLWN